MQLEEQIAERVAGFSYDSIDADTLHVLTTTSSTATPAYAGHSRTGR